MTTACSAATSPAPLHIQNKAHRIRLNPTPEQVHYLKRACGTRRFIYNWGLAEWQRQYHAYKEEQASVPKEQWTLQPPNALALKRQFNALRKVQFPWTYEVTKCVVEGAFDDLSKAFTNFFDGRTHYPKFKKKGKAHDSFYLSNEKITIGSHWIAVSGLGRFLANQQEQATGQKVTGRAKLRRTLGTINLAEKLRFAGKIMSATVSHHADWWYVSIHVEGVPEVPARETSQPATSVPIVGIDVGLKTAAVVSDGRRLENQKPFARLEDQVRRAQRALSRCQKTKDPVTGHWRFSKHYYSQRVKVARLQAHIANIRADAQHKFSTDIARSCPVVGIEDLNIQGMMKNRRKAKAVADAAMGQLLRFVENKVRASGGEVFIASRWFPSTKLCSNCGHKKKRMPEKHRTYICVQCGQVIDRDLNAARNLAAFAREQYHFKLAVHAQPVDSG
jgi:putative transposase